MVERFDLIATTEKNAKMNFSLVTIINVSSASCTIL